MKTKSSAFSWLTGVVVTGLIVVNGPDLADLLKGKRDYPFGSEFFGAASIYGSKESYLLYNALFVLLLMTTLVVLLRGNQKVDYVLLLIDGFLFFYPMISSA